MDAMGDTEAGQFLVRFWGVRGSYPTPGPQTVRHGGNTSCIEVQVGGHTLILDAGSGLIRLGEDLLHRPTKNSPDETLSISLFITHAHTDHLIGFPFFAPLFEPHASIDIFGPSLEGRSIERIVTPIMAPPYFPVDMRKLPSERRFHTISDEQYIFWRAGQQGEPPQIANDPAVARDGEVCVFAKFTQSHPLNGAIHFRIEYRGRSIIYATDVEWGEQCNDEFLEFARGADLLIHDAQYTTEDYEAVKHGFGHSSVNMATSVAREAQVRSLVLFHHEPNYDDEKLDALEARARAQFPCTRSAFEGMEIDLLGSQTDEAIGG
jgi:phosphoribosyl 1,2-cyclic phosphodiesterase